MLSHHHAATVAGCLKRSTYFASQAISVVYLVTKSALLVLSYGHL